jgi:hypothetical protein
MRQTCVANGLPWAIKSRGKERKTRRFLVVGVLSGGLFFLDDSADGP